MQQNLETLEERKLRMTPVMKVMRSHVRLDATTLYALSWRAVKQDDADAPKKPERVERPSKRHFASNERVFNRYEATQRRKKRDAEMRYIECRGLRFCPERRKHYDRDASSARAIAGLRCLKLKGFGRPTIFTRAGHVKK
jgi:hypothetical protein